jgi:biopolymer transport protein ExbB
MMSMLRSLTSSTYLLALALCLALQFAVAGPLGAQENGTADPLEQATPASSSGDTAVASEDAPPASDSTISHPQRLISKPMDLFNLLVKGGWLMIPIGMMSVAVVMLAIERSFVIRRGRVIPSALVDGLADLSGVPGVIDPRKAYRLCRQYPSPAARVVHAMLLKIGRPHSEVEHAVAEAAEREAERLYATVRWLNLFAAVAPLTGLLGTVWGMILSFYDTTQLTAGQNRAEYLAQGIYIALVTTLGGLVVAIPAAVLAHYFEGRVIKLFHEIDELLFSLMPQIERYEGRLRVTPHSLSSADDPSHDSVASHPSAEPPRRGPAKAV